MKLSPLAESALVKFHNPAQAKDVRKYIVGYSKQDTCFGKIRQVFYMIGEFFKRLCEISDKDKAVAALQNSAYFQSMGMKEKKACEAFLKTLLEFNQNKEKISFDQYQNRLRLQRQAEKSLFAKDLYKHSNHDFFCLKDDNNIGASSIRCDLKKLNDRVIDIFTKLKDKNSFEYAALKKELAQFGRKGLIHLRCNLIIMNSRFFEEQKSNCIVRLVRAIVNCVAKIFCCQEPYPNVNKLKLQKIDVGAASDIMEGMLEELIQEKKEDSSYTFEVNGHTSKELTEDNIQALELGYKDSISFKLGSNSYTIHFDEKKKEFVLGFWKSAKELGFHELGKQHVFSKVQEFRAKVIDKEEKKELLVGYKTWYEKQGRKEIGGRAYSRLSLLLDHEYQILSDTFESVTFKIAKKAQEASSVA